LNTTANGNTAMGMYTLMNNTGHSNTSVGSRSLQANTTGTYNNAMGIFALTRNTGGSFNTALSQQALYMNTTGNNNTAIGGYALYTNTTASNNTANGFYALRYNLTGYDNTASGRSALYTNTTGYYNTASGGNALFSNTTASFNTAVGSYALYDANRTTDVNAYNTAIGYKAGDTGTNDITTGQYNVLLGASTAASAAAASNQIVIGYGVSGTGDNQIAFGNTNITHIKAQVNSITAYSDKRIKKDIRDTDLGLAFINKLRPVKYKLKNPADYPASLIEKRFKTGEESRPKDDETVYDGLIAQEVKASLDKMGLEWSGWSKNDSDGKQGIQYGALVVPLIKAVQELSAKVEKLESQLEATGVDVSASQ
jgi:hypothetical protein